MTSDIIEFCAKVVLFISTTWAVVHMYAVHLKEATLLQMTMIDNGYKSWEEDSNGE
jgi:hypothetical protein